MMGSCAFLMPISTRAVREDAHLSRPGGARAGAGRPARRADRRGLIVWSLPLVAVRWLVVVVVRLHVAEHAADRRKEASPTAAGQAAMRAECVNRSSSSPAPAARSATASSRASRRAARRSSRSTSARSTPALAPLVTREFTGSITDTSLLDRMLAEFEVDRVFHLAALLSTRVRVHAGHGASRQRRRHAQPARVRAAAGRIARPAGAVRLSLVDRRLRAARPRGEGRAGARPRGRVRASDDDVRVQQAVLRAARALLRAVTTSSCRPTRFRASISAASGFPV